MVKNLVTVCIFCFLCATHSPCASHAEVTDGVTSVYDNRIPYKDAAKSNTTIARNENTTNDDGDYLEQLFRLYGDGKRINLDGFQRIIKRLDLIQELASRIEHRDNTQHDHDHDHDHNNEVATGKTTCPARQKLYENIKNSIAKGTKGNNDTLFIESCPVLLSSILLNCKYSEDAVLMSTTNATDSRTYHAWVYSMLAITLISACGIFGLAVIPVMQKRFYQPLLQFLVALAVGTLAGDALLHLLPHAMTSHEHEESADHREHDQNMWKGVVAMLGLILFFFVERFIMLIAKWRKRKQQQEKLPTRLKVIKPETSTQLTNAADKQCMHKYSSFPYCYDEIRKEIEDTIKYGEMKLDGIGIAANFTDIEKNQNHTECPDDSNKTNCSEINKMLPVEHKQTESNIKDDTDSVEYTVILREHERGHHGHSHTHGHVHAPPKSITSVAWMVIMGDGLHNFTDGMAIGAAFASSTAGGFSTAVAVFCHELPHELGDFAMLLKAGMSMKQALYYNLLSSVLCLFGNLFGLWLGNTEAASSWIFAAAAGMFLYIALVDMIPELSSGHEDEGNLLQCALHLLGLLLGFGIMALIAMYEHDLKSLFHET